MLRFNDEDDGNSIFNSFNFNNHKRTEDDDDSILRPKGSQQQYLDIPVPKRKSRKANLTSFDERDELSNKRRRMSRSRGRGSVLDQFLLDTKSKQKPA